MIWLLILHMLSGDIIVPSSIVSFQSEERCTFIAIITVQQLMEEGRQFDDPPFTCVPQGDL